MVLLRKKFTKEKRGKPWSIIHKEERDLIQLWRCKRLKDQRMSYRKCLLYSFSLDTLKSFLLNFNFMVLIQMIIAVVAVFIFQHFEISVDINVSLFVSPIVFPLAFSINSDFQRREKVLEDLAVFKSSGMVWYFCMREWKQAAGLDTEWLNDVHTKLKSLLFHLCEYLLTTKTECRKIILRAMYEDFSDANILIERLRESDLPTNSAIVSRSVHLLHMMCLSFERLRVVREYRSPRSIRSFNKVFIMFLPIILGPYFVHIGKHDHSTWEPYYLAVLLAVVFSTLQSAQDKLDDPFDGMGEDDINLDTIDEWALDTFENNNGSNKNRNTADSGHFSTAESAFSNVRIAECFGVLATSSICSPSAVDGNVDFLRYPPYAKTESPSLDLLNKANNTNNDDIVINLNDKNIDPDERAYFTKTDANNQSEYNKNHNSSLRYPDADRTNRDEGDNNRPNNSAYGDNRPNNSSYLDLGIDNYPHRDYYSNSPCQKRRFSEMNGTGSEKMYHHINRSNSQQAPTNDNSSSTQCPEEQGCRAFKYIFYSNPWKKKTKGLQGMLAVEAEKRGNGNQGSDPTHINNQVKYETTTANTSNIQLILDLNGNVQQQKAPYYEKNENNVLYNNSNNNPNNSCYGDKNNKNNTSPLLSLPLQSVSKRKNNIEKNRDSINSCNDNNLYVKFEKP